MYLSCYTLDLRQYNVRKALNNAYEMHRSVMSAFATVDDASPRNNLGVLYRLHTLGRAQKLYVSSLDLPINEMPKGFIKDPNSPKDISSIIDRFENDMVLCYDIMTMPFKKVKSDTSSNSKRVFLGRSDDRERWLLDKASQNGFKVLSLIEENSTNNKLKAGGFKSIIFKGTLQITDKAKFIKAYMNGIGPEKAFGCGMLLLHRA